MKSILSLNIKKLRMFKNMNQEEFSALFEVKRGTLGSYEEGRAEPKLDFLLKLAEYFKLSLDDIIRKELTVNQIAHFELPLKKQEADFDKIAKELSLLSSRIGSLELKITKSLKQNDKSN